jgi:hypothetical protein
MAVLTRDNAVEFLTRKVKEFGSDDVDDLVEVYNELYPDEPIATDADPGDESWVRRRVIARMEAGLEPEEIVSLWTVIFPFQLVLYDEWDDRILVNEPLTEPTIARDADD